MLKTKLQWAIDNDVEIKLVKVKDRFALTLSKGDIGSTLALDKGFGFDLAQHLLYPAIDAIRHEYNRNPPQSMISNSTGPTQDPLYHD